MRQVERTHPFWYLLLGIFIGAASTVVLGGLWGLWRVSPDPVIVNETAVEEQPVSTTNDPIAPILLTNADPIDNTTEATMVDVLMTSELVESAPDSMLVESTSEDSASDEPLETVLTVAQEAINSVIVSTTSAPDEAPTVAPASPVVQEDDPVGRLIQQAPLGWRISGFASRTDAETFRAQCLLAGFEAKRVQVLSPRKNTHIVRLGPFHQDRETAAQRLSTLKRADLVFRPQHKF